MPWCTNPTVRIPRMFRAITIVTMKLISPGTSFPRTIRKLSRGSMSGFTVSRISLRMCVKLARRVLISSSRNRTRPRRSITGGIDERNLLSVGDDDRRGGAYVEGGAYGLCRSRSAQYRVQPGANHGGARYGDDLRVGCLRRARSEERRVGKGWR